MPAAGQGGDVVDLLPRLRGGRAGPRHPGAERIALAAQRGGGLGGARVHEHLGESHRGAGPVRGQIACGVHTVVADDEKRGAHRRDGVVDIGLGRLHRVDRVQKGRDPRPVGGDGRALGEHVIDGVEVRVDLLEQRGPGGGRQEEIGADHAAQGPRQGFLEAQGEQVTVQHPEHVVQRHEHDRDETRGVHVVERGEVDHAHDPHQSDGHQRRRVVVREVGQGNAGDQTDHGPQHTPVGAGEDAAAGRGAQEDEERREHRPVPAGRGDELAHHRRDGGGGHGLDREPAGGGPVTPGDPPESLRVTGVLDGRGSSVRGVRSRVGGGERWCRRRRGGVRTTHRRCTVRGPRTTHRRRIIHHRRRGAPAVQPDLLEAGVRQDALGEPVGTHVRVGRGVEPRSGLDLGHHLPGPRLGVGQARRGGVLVEGRGDMAEGGAQVGTGGMPDDQLVAGLLGVHAHVHHPQGQGLGVPIRERLGAEILGPAGDGAPHRIDAPEPGLLGAIVIRSRRRIDGRSGRDS